MIVCAFPATGKTWLAEHSGAEDCDSSGWSWSEPGVRHPDWPLNYVGHLLKRRWVSALQLASSHTEVRDTLRALDVPYLLAYPTPDQREEYRERMVRRGSPERLVAFVMDSWEDLLRSCREDRGCVRHVLIRPGQYLDSIGLPPTASTPA